MIIFNFFGILQEWRMTSCTQTLPWSLSLSMLTNVMTLQRKILKTFDIKINVTIILINSVINVFKGQVCSEKLLVELALLILGSFYGRKRMELCSRHIKLEHEVLYPYIPALVVMTHILVASCIVRRWKTVNKS